MPAFISEMFTGPNTGAASGGAQQGGEFARQQARQQAEWARLLGDELMGAGRDASGRSFAFSDEAMGNSRYFMDRYKNIFAPNEERLAKDVAGYDSPEEMARVRGEAAGNANQAFDTAQASRNIQLTRMGVNPNSGRFAAPGSDDLNRTIATSDSMNRATAGRRDAAIGLRGNLASFGTGISQLGAQQQQLGLGAVAQGTGVMNAAGTAASGIRTAPANWINAGTGAFGTAGNIITNAYNARENVHHNFNQDAMGWTSMGMTSSKKAKDRVGRVIESEVVRRIKSMPVDRWRYKKEIVPDQSSEGGQREHIGPYAEDFKKRFGVGDGKTINFIDAFGVLFASAKGQAKEIDKLKAARA
jgi:hypothetical protein